MSLHPHNIAQKTEVMVEHFRHFTRAQDRRQGQGDGGDRLSRLHAVRYKQAFDKYIAEKGYTDIKTLVAFSGTVIDPDAPGVEYTEVGMNNGIREKELPERFGTDEYQVLLVAEKYQTGFDQPLLHTMYVDKRLAGIQAVQTLSRLNRTYPGKEDTFVLDFVNEPEEIQEAFQPYYEQTARRRAGRPAAALRAPGQAGRAAGLLPGRRSRSSARSSTSPRRPDARRPRADERLHRPGSEPLHGTRRRGAGGVPEDCWSPSATCTPSSPRSSPSRTPTWRSCTPTSASC